MTPCPFCRIVQREAPAEVVYETDLTLAFFPTEPATRGHTMVIPKRHIVSFLETDPSEVEPIGLTVLRVSRALQEVLNPEGMNLITSAGEAASQSVAHMHVHIVPRWTGDEVGEIWPPKSSTSGVILEQLADAVREFCGVDHLEDRNPD